MALFKGYKPGDHLMRCDRTGRKYLASDMRKEWTGNYVHKDFYEDRHPQDFVKGRKDDQTVHPNRPDTAELFIDSADPTASTYVNGTDL